MPSADYAAGYRQGVADVSARVVGAVANYLGTTDPDHPLIQRIVQVVGECVSSPPGEEP